MTGATQVDQKIEMLEFQELDAPSNLSVCPIELYIELLAAYLYKNDLMNARFLWKRIPSHLKDGNSDLENLHRVYMCLWQNNISAFFKSIDHEWSETIAEIMSDLKVKMYNDSIDLVGKAYSSIYEDALCELLNQKPDRITEVCQERGWEIKTGEYPRLIIPVAPVVEKVSTESSEDLLANLADFVSFLEN